MAQNYMSADIFSVLALVVDCVRLDISWHWHWYCHCYCLICLLFIVTVDYCLLLVDIIVHHCVFVFNGDYYYCSFFLLMCCIIVLR